MTKIQKLLFVGVIILAVFFRYYLIGEMPGGLFPDEAANGLDINSMQQGDLAPFYERGNGREALFFYFLWASVEVFGKGPWQHHIVSSLVGLLAVIFCFLATKKIFSIHAKNKEDHQKAYWTALVASFLMAISTWHIVLSRTAFRANLIPLFIGMVFYFLLSSYLAPDEKKRRWWAFAGGAAFALGFYSYIAYRIIVPILGILVVWPLFAAKRSHSLRKVFNEWSRPIAFFVVAFIIFFAPLGKYFIDHPGSFIGRSGQVSIFNPDLNKGDLPGTLLHVTQKSFFAYFTEGDLNWRHNVSGVPFLPPLVSFFFAIGLVLSTWYAILYIFGPQKNWDKWPHTALVGLFFGMLLPVVTTAEGIPHGLRSIGTIPAVFIISAWPIVSFAYWLYHRFKSSEIIKISGFAFILSLVVPSYLYYFIYTWSSPENYYFFRSDLTEVSKYLVDRCETSLNERGVGTKDSTYLVLDKFSVQTPDYMTVVRGRDLSYPCNKPYVQVDPERAFELAGLKSGDHIVFTQSSLFDTKKFSEHHPETKRISLNQNRFGQDIWAVYIVK